MEKFTTESKARHFAVVHEPIVIEEKQNTRRVFLANINDVRTEHQQTVSGTILHQRKKGSDEWEAIEAINLSKLKGGSGVKITLDSRQLRRLYEGLNKLYELSGKGVQMGTTQFAVGLADEIIKVPKERSGFISQLLSQNFGEEVWDQLVHQDPDLATKLSIARIHTHRSESLQEFERSLAGDEPESYWQNFFSNNQWIFGYGLKYCFLSQLEEQPNYGGQNFQSKGAQKGDYLMNTEAENKFTVLVEIKKASSKLLARTTAGDVKKYRNGACLIGSELAGGVSQIQINCITWQRKSTDPENYDALHARNIHTVNPKGILVIGNTSELANRNQIETFEAFRNSISNPEIVTFDELFQRAKYIISQISQDEDDNIDPVDQSPSPF